MISTRFRTPRKSNLTDKQNKRADFLVANASEDFWPWAEYNKFVRFYKKNKSGFKMKYKIYNVNWKWICCYGEVGSWGKSFGDRQSCSGLCLHISILLKSTRFSSLDDVLPASIERKFAFTHHECKRASFVVLHSWKKFRQTVFVKMLRFDNFFRG